MSNSLDPFQAQHFVGPDLGPNCLQRLSVDNVSSQGVKIYNLYIQQFHMQQWQFVCVCLIEGLSALTL